MRDGPSAGEWPNLKAMTILPGRVEITSSQNGLMGACGRGRSPLHVGGGMTASQSPSYSFSVHSWLKQSGASRFTPPGKRVAACENGTHSRCDPSPTAAKGPRPPLSVAPPVPTALSCARSRRPRT